MGVNAVQMVAEVWRVDMLIQRETEPHRDSHSRSRRTRNWPRRWKPLPQCCFYRGADHIGVSWALRLLLFSSFTQIKGVYFHFNCERTLNYLLPVLKIDVDFTLEFLIYWRKVFNFFFSVVYEHRSRLEKSLQKERLEHKKAKEGK